MANLKAPCEWCESGQLIIQGPTVKCEWCEFGQVYKWVICKNELLPNGPKWANSKLLASEVTE